MVYPLTISIRPFAIDPIYDLWPHNWEVYRFLALSLSLLGFSDSPRRIGSSVFRFRDQDWATKDTWRCDGKVDSGKPHFALFIVGVDG